MNLGKACPKGFQFLGHLDAPERAVAPHLRGPDGVLRPVDWDAALAVFCEKFKGLQAKHGPESVAFISTGQLTNEEFAFLGALAKFGMGWVHGDGNTRQCMASAVVAHKQSFGFDAPPFTYKDFEEADVLVFVGSNPAIAHPIMWQRVKRSERGPRIIVIDPRRTETAGAPGVEHLAIRPKTDLALLYGVARELIGKGWIDEDFVAAHTSGYEALRAHVEPFTLSRVSAEAGLTEQQVEALAATIHEGERVSFWWMVGINQGYQAVRTAQAIINLALLTGNIGRPGTGANSITGQCNAMGTRLFGNTSSLFCGRDYADPVHRREVAALLGMDEHRIPQGPGLTYDRILEAVDTGQIKGLWIICTNPAHSWIDRNHFKRVLAKAEFVVVQDMFLDTETARFAHLVLPAAGCGEKDGTFINSERRFGVVRRILDPPGDALPDMEIFRRVAEAWGCDDLFGEWSSPEAVFQVLKRASENTPCDFSGIEDYAMLERCGGIQWPYVADGAAAGGGPCGVPGGEAGDTPGGAAIGSSGDARGPAPIERQERRLFEDGVFFHPDGRARFVVEDPAEPPEAPSEQYPLILLTGRGSVYQWHTLTRTDRAALLKRASPDPAYVEMNPRDAETLHAADGDWVEVVSPRGTARARVKLSDGIQPGEVFMPMHFSETNDLTISSFDPYSRQPSYKYSAVRIVLAALLLVACLGLAGLALAGCGGPASIAHAPGANELVMQVTTGGGFVPIEYQVTLVPEFSLYGDGRVIVPGPQIEIYPRPALPNIQTTVVPEKSVQAMLTAARGAGLFDPAFDYGQPSVADGPTTTLVINADSATNRSAIYALTVAGAGGLTEKQRQARKGVSNLIGDLTVVSPFASGEVVWESFAFSALAVYSAPAGDDPVDAPAANHLDWPLGDLSALGEPVQNGGLRKMVVSGADLEELRPLLEQATELTAWRSGGVDYRLLLRPLLPGEAG